jgi:hypothetical protein
MQLPPILQGDSRVRLIQGAVVGSLLTMGLGFGLGGWQLQHNAERRAELRVNAAVVKALTPICVERFRQAADVKATTVALQATDRSATKATVAALAPICVDKFHRAADSQAKLVALKAVDSWKQDTFVAKGGWATFPGSKGPNDEVAQACAEALSGQK